MSYSVNSYKTAAETNLRDAYALNPTSDPELLEAMKAQAVLDVGMPDNTNKTAWLETAAVNADPETLIMINTGVYQEIYDNSMIIIDDYLDGVIQQLLSP